MDQGHNRDVQQPADSAMDPGMAPAEPNRGRGEPQPGQSTSREQGDILPNQAPVDIHRPPGDVMQEQTDEEQVEDQRRNHGVQQTADSVMGSGTAPGEPEPGQSTSREQGNEHIIPNEAAANTHEGVAGIHSPQGDDEDDTQIQGNEKQPLIKH